MISFHIIFLIQTGVEKTIIQQSALEIKALHLIFFPAPSGETTKKQIKTDLYGF